ncbi:hypothetical protein GCM10011579_034950 [Streptomyces albiflavescens]|uniref:Molybdenum cofactor biosynthesis protein A-like twitch domain-containing protein n=1 Tax=Streptomyces albiflavescens TaxID=1623582 RepID=A0A918D4D6_9ACTN|nr:hypothetical protein GCM10011579_034950 [Streptomyces albiflavescens]
MLIDTYGRVATDLRVSLTDRVNVSLDTLRSGVFRALTRRDRHHEVVEGPAAAGAAGLTPVKVNTVLMPGFHDDEAPELLAWVLENDYARRFIEQMPLDAQHGWKRDGVITAGHGPESLRTRFTLTREPDEARGSAPAERWILHGGPARVGVIASVPRPFCGACDRTRLTADGQVRTCLFAREESDLPATLRSGGRTRRSRGRGSTRCGRRRPAPDSTSRPSGSPTGRCRPSGADARARRGNDVHRQNWE